MKRLFIIALSIAVVLAGSLGAFLFVSLIPFFKPIGLIAAIVVMLGLLCVAALMISFTYSRISHNRLTRRVIVAGDVVAYVEANGGFVHLSAMHEAAKIPATIVPALPSPDPRWDAVLDLRKEGRGMHQIAKDLKVPYNKVRTFLNQVEKNQSET